jgi:hypothetical protein
VKAIPGFNAGAKFKKFDVDRIMHSMIFDHLLQETGQDTKGGFSVDYVNLGENAQAMLQGRRKLIVEFPKAKEVARSKSPKKKEANPAPKKTRTKKTVSGASTNAGGKSGASTNTAGKKNTDSVSPKDTSCVDVDGGLQFTEKVGYSSDESSDEEYVTATGPGSGSGHKNNPHVLPSDHSAVLVKRIKQLTSSWATEEQMMGNKVFCKFASAVMFP